MFVLGQLLLQGEEEFFFGQVEGGVGGGEGVFQIEAVAEGDIEAGGVDAVRVGVFDDAIGEQVLNVEVGEEHLGVLVGGVTGAVVNDWLTTGETTEDFSAVVATVKDSLTVGGEVAQGEDGGATEFFSAFIAVAQGVEVELVRAAAADLPKRAGFARGAGGVVATGGWGGHVRRCYPRSCHPTVKSCLPFRS